ncbi:MAG: hypothetical protein JWM20_914 [Patescibacteria group bacterium]|nr:hypothetical protein [Patescibacteria group bacterium]
MKNKHSVQIFLAIFCGVLIGLGIAQSVSGSLASLVLGFIVGGLAGYIVYDPKDFFQGIRNAWSMSHSRMGKLKVEAVYQVFRTFGTICALLFCVFCIPVFFVSFFAVNGYREFGMFWLHFLSSSAGVGIAFCILCSFAYLSLMGYFKPDKNFAILFQMIRSAKKEANGFLPEENPSFLRWLLLITPPAFIFQWSSVLWRNRKEIAEVVNATIPFLVKTAGQIGLFIWNYIKLIFNLVHSNERMICLIYSVIGIGVGYLLSWHPIIAALISATVGLGGYKIFMAIRPRESQTAR